MINNMLICIILNGNLLNITFKYRTLRVAYIRALLAYIRVSYMTAAILHNRTLNILHMIMTIMSYIRVAYMTAALLHRRTLKFLLVVMGILSTLTYAHLSNLQLNINFVNGPTIKWLYLKSSCVHNTPLLNKYHINYEVIKSLYLISNTFSLNNYILYNTFVTLVFNLYRYILCSTNIYNAQYHLAKHNLYKQT